MAGHTRRAALTGAASAAAIGLSPGTAHAVGGRRHGGTTFVFAAGSNGAGTTVDELALRGHRCVGVTPPGFADTAGQYRRSYQAPQDLAALATEPSPLAGVTLADQVDATVAVVRRAACLGPVVLVGGSIGGATITLVANRVPELIDRLVYDTAYCCTELASPDEYLRTPEGAASEVGELLGFLAADPAVIGAVRSNWRLADPDLLATAKRVLIEDGTDAELFALLNSMAPDEILGKGAEDSRGDPRGWGRVPRAYIRHARDRVLPLPLQNRMIAEADRRTPGNRFTVFDLDTGHVPNVAKTAELIEILDRLARRRS
ncbi:alpha/beta fold hydrolase [Amycolatopsis cihanbeyliensis]|uniref:Pimeloyl-ACP methyl ester carboxylesterase n=1 Tax=Amycolatopsis cihanbeyliensis TaxID=1128664 RepID=A0A542DKB7_AMYCI|nr:alpha/beta hydrolase [Amycolatopsis cihanbeyliensis]TQJ03538.1 pimeloyl-ACP methyl ester carboxylesterase [Amycolatopsis cihanbeyliensis]